MTRGQRLSIEERIAKVEKELEVLNEKLTDAKEKVSAKTKELNELKDEQRAEKMRNLLDYVEASGKNPDEIIDILKSHNE